MGYFTNDALRDILKVNIKIIRLPLGKFLNPVGEAEIADILQQLEESAYMSGQETPKK